jgi:hypothetical protein
MAWIVRKHKLEWRSYGCMHIDGVCITHLRLMSVRVWEYQNVAIPNVPFSGGFADCGTYE